MSSVSAKAEGAAATAASGAFNVCVMLYKLVVTICTTLGSCIKKCPASVVSMFLRVLNLGNAVLLGATCYFAMTTIVSGNVTRTFLAIYCGIFGVLLALVSFPPLFEPSFIPTDCCPQYILFILTSH